mmetsp:Transcript_83085/g.164818  ORF Transcript_83085/g.164818 Transcript_83085/m.164818 type:complete len:344 (+) Transcript_83085:26-1057(+)
MLACKVGFGRRASRSQLWLFAAVVATFSCWLYPARTGNCRPSRELPLAFLQAAEWTKKSRGLNAEDTLPLIADVTVDVGINGINISSGGRPCTARLAGRGSYIADFGILDVPYIGELRARAGLRYSRLYPRGALELGFRKELRTDQKRGYELFVGGQAAGDDRRFDVVTDIGALKHFRNARAHYRFIWGSGAPYDDKSKEGPTWCEVGSSFGVTQQLLPPNGHGELTVGWRSGFFDNGLEGVSGPKLLKKRGGPLQRDAPKIKGLLDSTPFAAYGVDLKAGDSVGAHLSWTMLPEQDTLEHALRLRVLRDASGGTATLTTVVDQSLSHPQRLRVRFGGSYRRD